MYASPDKINKKIDRLFGTDNKKLSKIQQKYKFELENDNLLSFRIAYNTKLQSNLLMKQTFKEENFGFIFKIPYYYLKSLDPFGCCNKQKKIPKNDSAYINSKK